MALRFGFMAGGFDVVDMIHDYGNSDAIFCLV
jgi:hypothetical protein